MALANGGADVSDRDEDGNTVLHIAAAYDRSPNILSFLIETGADPDATNDSGETPLHQAAWRATDADAIRGLVAAAEAPCQAHEGDAPVSMLGENAALREDDRLVRLFHETCAEE